MAQTDQQVITALNEEIWSSYAHRTIPTWQFDYLCYWERLSSSRWRSWRDQARSHPGEGLDFARTCVRFTHKVEAQIGALSDPQARYVIWLDADVEQTGEITEAAWLSLRPRPGDLCSALMRQDQYPETGWICWDTEHPLLGVFLDQWQREYFDDRVWSRAQWHDAWVWGELCQELGVPVTNLSPMSHRGEAFGLSKLAGYFRHRKGPRKWQ